MHPRARHRGFTLLEIAISLGLVIALLAVLLPALASARVASHRDECANNLRYFGSAWELYLDEHDGEFPYVPIQAGWHYGGVRFSTVDEQPFLDVHRPLTAYLSGPARGRSVEDLFRCPADDGIHGVTRGVGTGDRTAYRSFGTSYRANADLFDASRVMKATPEGAPRRALRRSDITTVASRLVVMGDPVWYEIHYATGREASWHGEHAKGNLLFLDGAVKYRETFAPPRIGPAVFEPKLTGP